MITTSCLTAFPGEAMSSTYLHTTPAFPRTLRGPRGGHAIAPTPCSECVAFQTCRPGACSAPFGCDSWVDYDGRRVDIEADEARLLALADARAGRIPEGLTAEDWAAMTPQDRDTAEGIDALAAMPTPAEDAASLAALAREQAAPAAALGPLFQR